MVVYSANDVLTFAKALKRRRQRTYATAAPRAKYADAEALLVGLAAEAHQQLQTTALLQRQLPAGDEHSSIDNPPEAGVVLEAMAHGDFLDYAIDPQITLTGKETAAEVAYIADCLAKNTVIFYQAVREMVTVEGGRHHVDLLITAETKNLGDVAPRSDQTAITFETPADEQLREAA